MTDSDYKAQLRAQQQALEDHRRKQIELATITANAAVQTANTMEKARREQKDSLDRQEYIANTNSFRNSVLNALPLIADTDRKRYLVEQISTRLPSLVSGDLILSADNLSEISGLTQEVSGLIKTNEFQQWSQLLIKRSELTSVHEQTCDTLYWWHWNPNLNPIGNLIKLYFIWAFSIFAYGIGIVIYIVKRKNRKNAMNNLQVFLNENDKYISIGPENLRHLLMKTCRESKQIQNFRNLQPISIASDFIETQIWKFITEEQSFLPVALRPTIDDWKTVVITNRTFSIISKYQEEVDKIINSITVDHNGASVGNG